ncbi:MAG: hypothetical protein HY391_05550 [Deltaproteobacteria bacterium]|nr:hypothetical protein [Deltaproteobacteria bacterium]
MSLQKILTLLMLLLSAFFLLSCGDQETLENALPKYMYEDWSMQDSDAESKENKSTQDTFKKLKDEIHKLMNDSADKNDRGKRLNAATQLGTLKFDADNETHELFNRVLDHLNERIKMEEDNAVKIAMLKSISTLVSKQQKNAEAVERNLRDLESTIERMKIGTNDKSVEDQAEKTLKEIDSALND